MSINEEELKKWIEQVTKKLAHLEANQIAIINGDFCDANTEPKEPLIKDEKIRKAVRAWAEANDFTKLEFMKWADNHWLLRAKNEDGHEFDMDFFDNECKNLPKYEDETFYTIAELCGEEKAPEPIEPTFVDLNERVKEKGEE